MQKDPSIDFHALLNAVWHLGSCSFQMPATMPSWFSLVEQSLDDLMMLFLTFCFHADVSKWYIYRRHCWCCKVFQVCTVWYFSLFNVEIFFFSSSLPFWCWLHILGRWREDFVSIFALNLICYLLWSFPLGSLKQSCIVAGKCFHSWHWWRQVLH